MNKDLKKGLFRFGLFYFVILSFRYLKNCLKGESIGFFVDG